MIAQASMTQTVAELAAEVRASLSKPQKELPSKLLYDDLGSVLFEGICLLPEYGLSRAGLRLLSTYAGAMMRGMTAPITVIELGSGTGKKARFLLEALRRKGPITYCPVDISPAALERCRQEVGSLEGVQFVPWESGYLEGLTAASERRRADDHLLVLFLGSTIGNFDRPAAQTFLAEVRARLRPGDAMVLAADLEKPVPTLIRAYDDPLGLTAAFNLNVLNHVNRLLDGNFDLRAYEHEARWNPIERRIEMHLRARADQHVTLRRADARITIAQGESIWTESSHKFTASEVVSLAQRAGFLCQAQWVDEEWPFAQSLLLAE